jgi:hypothetical protein
LQLLPGEPLEKAVPVIQQQLAKTLLSNPPYEIRWLKAAPETAQSLLLECMLQPEVPAMTKLQGLGLADDQLDQVLVLRGLLAFNLLQHCLQSRHLVNYGASR